MIKIQNQSIQPSSINQSWMNQSPNQAIVQALNESSRTYSYQSMAALKFDVEFRANIINGAKQLARSQVQFATFYYSKCNRNYWDITSNGGFRLRSNVKASDAINDVFNHSRQYAFECATAMMIILYHAYLNTVGPDMFNARFSSLYLYDWHAHQHFPLSTVSISDYIPGDVLYFKNPDVNPKTPQWQGENAILLDDSTFYGHGVGIKSKSGIIQDLNTHRSYGASQSAYLMNQATRPRFDYLFPQRTSDPTDEDEIFIQVGNRLLS